MSPRQWIEFRDFEPETNPSSPDAKAAKGEEVGMPDLENLNKSNNIEKPSKYEPQTAILGKIAKAEKEDKSWDHPTPDEILAQLWVIQTESSNSDIANSTAVEWIISEQPRQA